MAARKKQSNKKTGATRNSDPGSSTLKRLIIVSLVILFAAFLIYLDKMPVSDEQVGSSKKQVEKKTVEQKKENKKEKYQFDFYTELSDREVETYKIEEEPVVIKKAPKKTVEKTIPKEIPVVSKQVTSKEKAVVKVVPQSNMLYQLQVGAFSDWSKADAMKGRLALLGVEPNIQVFHVKGQKIYRVRIGPTTDLKKIERIKIQLKAQNINTFIQKIKV